MAKMGIKETLELLDALGSVGAMGAEIAKDGFTQDDMPKIMGFFGNYQSLVEAFKGIDQIPAEMKDIDMEESKQIVDKVFEVASKIKEAV